MSTSLIQKSRKSGRVGVCSRNTNPWNNFSNPHSESICPNKWHKGTTEIPAPLEITAGTRLHAWQNTKTTHELPITCRWKNLLVGTSKSGFFTVKRSSATRKHLFFYPQGVGQVKFYIAFLLFLQYFRKYVS